MNTGPSDTKRMETKKNRVEIQPGGAALSGNFWRPMSFEELAAAQGVGPLIDIDALIGTWPGDVNDGFEAAVCRLRPPSERDDRTA